MRKFVRKKIGKILSSSCLITSPFISKTIDGKAKSFAKGGEKKEENSAQRAHARVRKSRFRNEVEG